MTIERLLLVLLAILLGLNCYCAVTTFAEFDPLDDPRYDKMLGGLDSVSRESQITIRGAVIAGRWSATNGRNLSSRTVNTDALMFAVVIGLMLRCWKRNLPADPS